MPALLLALALAAAPGPAPTSFGSFALRPPPGFHADPTLPVAESAALAPVYGPADAERRLVAYLVDGDEPDAASLSLSTIGAPLTLDPGARPLFAAAVVGHFKRQLGLAYELDHVSLAGSGSGQRIEVWGAVRAAGSLRTVEVAFFPGERTSTVAVISMPPARQAALSAPFAAALDSFEPREAPAPWLSHRAVVSLFVWGIAGLALVGLRMVQRRRAARLRAE